jgi:hypothetical protein
MEDLAASIFRVKFQGKTISDSMSCVIHFKATDIPIINKHQNRKK